MNQADAELLLGYRITPGWVFHEVNHAGKLSGFVMEKAAEVHCWRQPEFKGRWFTRQDVERILLPILKRYGKLTTKSMIGNLQSHRFLMRLGFKPLHQDDKCVHYELKELNHARY